MRALFRQYLQYGFWKVAVMRKHGGLASWRQAVPVLFVCSLVLLASMIPTALVLGLHAAAIVFAGALAAEVGVYALACGAAAMAVSRTLEWRSAALLPAVIGAYHVSYGLGFLIGILRPASRPARFLTALTR